MIKDWWQPPQLRIGEDSVAERRATWLELFFDLVFVVAIAQLAHKLNEDISLSGFFGFVLQDTFSHRAPANITPTNHQNFHAANLRDEDFFMETSFQVE